MEEERREKKEEIETQKEVQKKKTKKLFLILPLFLLMIGGGGYFFYSKKLASKEQIKEVKKEETERIGPILTLEPFLFNLKGGNSGYARVSIGIEVKDEKSLEETKKMVPALRDSILSFLSSKTQDVLIDPERREEMKKELCLHLKPLFKEGEEIKRVYITDIIIQ